MTWREGTDREESPEEAGGVTRRPVLGALAAAGLAGIASGSSPDDRGNGRESGENGNGDTNDTTRLQRAYRLRQRAAKDTLRGDLGGSGTYGRFERRHGTFTKGLPHDEFGEVDRDAYAALSTALEGTDVGAYNDIPLGRGRELVDPIAARAYNLQGADGHQEPMPPAPPVGSDVAAAEVVELYWRALLRDVPFTDYGRSADAQAAYDELTGLEGYEGPTGRGPRLDLFRSPYPGAREGPHVSQFLLQDAPYGSMRITNEQRPQEPGVDFMMSFDDWLAIRRGDGSAIGTESFSDERRRITNGRDLLTYVHRNVPTQSALTAAYYMIGRGIPFGADVAGTPLQTQNSFIQAGPPAVAALVAGVIDNAKHGTWYHKWLVHRRARPEKYGGLVAVHRSDEKRRSYDFLNDDLLGSEAVARTDDEYGTALLPQGYPEGSPTHPSYPAGHSVFVGASVTVLKALFDGSHTLDRTIRVTGDGRVEEIDAELTVRGELNKLASNHAFGRDFAGIHYRTDGREGHRLGERIALEYLKDEFRAAAVDFELRLRGFRGDAIVVTGEEITRE